MYYKVDSVLNDVKFHLDEKKPFSLVRVGDGDLKLLTGIHKGRINKQKFRRSGIPDKDADKLIQIYRDGCNTANYTSSFEHYLTDRMWNRKFSKGTSSKVQEWKKIYKNIGIINKNFCSPEIGFLMFVKDIENNLFNLLTNRKVCLITCYKQLGKIFQKTDLDVSVFTIPAIGRGHYNVYGTRIQQLEEFVRSKRHDIYLVSAGALGKGYSRHIKGAGGISIDIGQVAAFWNNGILAGRFLGILKKADQFTFKFTKKGEEFRKFL